MKRGVRFIIVYCLANISLTLSLESKMSISCHWSKSSQRVYCTTAGLGKYKLYSLKVRPSNIGIRDTYKQGEFGSELTLSELFIVLPEVAYLNSSVHKLHWARVLYTSRAKFGQENRLVKSGLVQSYQKELIALRKVLDHEVV